MSVEAITWALAQPVQHSSAKFVLVVMANRADGDMVCWPSMTDICSQTSQDRKTVLENMRRLREAGFIEDTGLRKGSTNQVIVYRLNTPKFGTVEDARKRNSTENGTVPVFPANSTVFPAKEARFSHETGPKTGHGTIKEPSIEPSMKPKKRAKKPRAVLGVDDLTAVGVEHQVAEDWLEIRKQKRLPLTRTALDEIVAEVEKAGMTLPSALKLCCGRGWAGFHASWLITRTIPRDGSASSDKFRVADLDHSSSRAAMEASIRKHGITVPDGDIEF